jgi:hypothetical protein
MKLIDESGVNKTPLMEANIKAVNDMQKKVTEADIKQLAERYGIKNHAAVFDFTRPDFSIKKFREGSYAIASKLREAQAELAFGALLRAGVQNIFNSNYQAVELTYKAAVREVSSNKRAEFYAPLERVGYPKRIAKGDSFPETNFKGLDIEIVNQKEGLMIAFERELLDDDMTGQIADRSSQLGVNSALKEEAFVWNRMFAGTLSLDSETLPLSETYATPFSTSGIHAGGYGINATSNGRLSQSQIQAGWILALGMKDQSGRPFVVMPKLLAVSKQDTFLAKVLLQSEMNPSMSSTATADIGKSGSINSINPIQNLVGYVVSRFIPDYGAMLIDPGKGFIFQRRDPVEVVQENPQSGPAFSQDVFRYKTRSRWEADFIDPKFHINLNANFSST